MKIQLKQSSSLLNLESKRGIQMIARCSVDAASCSLHAASSMKHALKLKVKESICVYVSEKGMPLLSQRCTIVSSVSALFGTSLLIDVAFITS